MNQLIIAIIIGLIFGYILQRVGAADPDKIIGMLRLSDLHLMKAILGGIGIASGLLFIALISGVANASHISVKTLHVGVAVGGLIFGLGWAIAGFCAGTGIVALGAGRLDALFFVLGGLLGAGVFIKLYGSIKDTAMFHKLLGGKITLVQTGGADALINGGIAPFLGITIGILLIVAAFMLPQKN